MAGFNETLFNVAVGLSGFNQGTIFERRQLRSCPFTRAVQKVVRITASIWVYSKYIAKLALLLTVALKFQVFERAHVFPTKGIALGSGSRTLQKITLRIEAKHELKPLNGSYESCDSEVSMVI